MSISINNFKAKLVGGGARANLFKVTCNFPAYARGDSELASFMIKSASLPASTLAPIEIKHRGRSLSLAGERTFEPWSITIINDTKMEIRNAFERWMDGINSHLSNQGRTNPADYMVDMAVEQLDRQGAVTKRYDIRGAWPATVAAIELSNDSDSGIEDFQVTLQYMYWESNTTT